MTRGKYRTVVKNIHPNMKGVVKITYGSYEMMLQFDIPSLLLQILFKFTGLNSTTQDLISPKIELFVLMSFTVTPISSQNIFMSYG